MEVTDLIQVAIKHVLNQSSCDERLKEKLRLWRSGEAEGGERKREQQMTEYCRVEHSISFEMVFELYQQLKMTPLGMGTVNVEILNIELMLYHYHEMH